MPPLEYRKKAHVLPVLRIYTRTTLRYPWTLTLFVIGILGVQFASLATPLYLKQFIDVLSKNAPTAEVVQALYVILMAYGGLALVNWVFGRLQHFSTNRIEAEAMTSLANEAFANMLEHSQDFFLSSFSGTLTRRVTRFSRAYEQVFDIIMGSFLRSFVFAAGAIAVLYTRSHWLGLALLVWVVVFIAVQILMAIWKHPLRAARTAADSRLTGALSDAIGNHAAIHLFAAGAYERGVFGVVMDLWRKATIRTWWSNFTIQGVQQIFGICIEVGILGLGVVLWQQGTISVGDFVLIQAYVFGLIEQTWNIGNHLRALYDSFADAGEMVEIMELTREIQDRPNATLLKSEQGAIRFDRVSFTYASGRTVLADLNLHIRGG